MSSRKTQAHGAANAARRGVPTPEVIDVAPVVTEDEQLAVMAGGVIGQWVGQARAFFAQATAMELAAKDTLAKARTLIAPKTMEEDAAVQVFIRKTSVDKKAAVDHWEQITSVLFSWHKRSTAGRARAVTALDEANTISNRLHNGYVETERRRAAEAQEAERRRAEAQAQADRDAEVARIEAEAVKKESESADLSLRERAFIEHFIAQNGNDADETTRALRAASRAGYKDPKQGLKLILLKKIKDAMTAKIEAETIRRQAAAVREQPLDVQVETIKPNISTADTHDRTTHSYEVLDANLFIEAFRSGKYGIPTECVQPAPKGLGELARSLHERLNTIPGIRYVKTTKAI